MNHFVRMSSSHGVRPCGELWEAFIECAGKTIHLGLFDTEEEAAKFYDRVAFVLKIEPLNFPLLDAEKKNLRKLSINSKNILSNIIIHRRRENSPKYIGTYHVGNLGISRIKVNSKSNYLGSVESEEFAANLYDKAVYERDGVFAVTNALYKNYKDGPLYILLKTHARKFLKEGIEIKKRKEITSQKVLGNSKEKLIKEPKSKRNKEKLNKNGQIIEFNSNVEKDGQVGQNNSNDQNNSNNRNNKTGPFNKKDKFDKNNKKNKKYSENDRVNDHQSEDEDEDVLLEARVNQERLFHARYGINKTDMRILERAIHEGYHVSDYLLNKYLKWRNEREASEEIEMYSKICFEHLQHPESTDKKQSQNGIDFSFQQSIKVKEDFDWPQKSIEDIDNVNSKQFVLSIEDGEKETKFLLQDDIVVCDLDTGNCRKNMIRKHVTYANCMDNIEVVSTENNEDLNSENSIQKDGFDGRKKEMIMDGEFNGRN